MRYLCVLGGALLLINCIEKPNKPSFISFGTSLDSIYVIAKNKLVCPLYVKIEQRKTSNYSIKQLNSESLDTILKFKNDVDSLSILKSYKFAGYYGIYNHQGHDTLYNYSLPFKKGYESTMIQGYNGLFSHNGKFSAKTLDFTMNVGDTILASRDGIVVKISVEHNKQGTTEDFRKYGNYIMVYHNDNTFSQYVHLKQNGNLVAEGDSIKRNQPIALSGFTGLTTTPHLHFGVYKPTHTGFESIDIIIDSIPAKELKRGQIIIKD